MRQAIVTRYLSPSNVRNSRVKATARAGSIILPWDHALNTEQNHCAAAKAFAKKHNWSGVWFGGCLPNEDYAWANSDEPQQENRDKFTIGF